MIHLKKISINQLICLVITTQIGAHVLSIPYAESRHTGHDAWMSVLVGGVFAQVVILVVYRLGKRYPTFTFQQYVYQIVGRPIGVIVNLLFALYCAESSVMVAVSYADILHRWVLYETPWIVLVGFSFLMAAYTASSSLRSMSTVSQSVLTLFVICAAIILISGMGKGSWLNILPIGSHGIIAVLKDSIPSFWAYAGYELLLYVFPFVQCKKKIEILFAMSFANGITTFFYVLTTLIVTYNFSETQMNTITEPIVFILRKFRWPVVQSLDIVFMTIWLSVTTATVFLYLFLSARYVANLRKKEIDRHSLLVWLIAIICFAISCFGADRQRIFRYADVHNIISVIMIVMLPTVFLFGSILREKVAKG
ncbi:GerAB/ArcD/ProY family transporter [Gottfriedia acidiceleris]|uniref:Spore germination protein n=1 Tax=Gottfriedia acidiceleris TaxID=371036 RepID=A0ABY4JLB2_9BACI|nr:GerAB/ArcD/ProY family transporter [Gottfriedia acidiceleris]UPM53979.1 spore germination protein [Gottfriedia acidiceleris]